MKTRNIVTLMACGIVVVSLCSCGQNGAQNVPAQDAAAVTEGAASQEEENLDILGIDTEDVISVDDSDEVETADVETLKADLEKATEYLGSVMDMSKMTKPEDDVQDTSIYRNWDCREGAADFAFANEAEADGIKIEFEKTTIKDLKTLGFEISAYAEEVEPDTEAVVTIEKGDRQAVIALAPNNSDKAVSVDELPIYGFDSGLIEYALPFNYGGITEKSTMEDVIRILGAPNNSISLEASTVANFITLDYTNEYVRDGQAMSDVVKVQFVYDANANDCTLASVSATHRV